MTNKPTWADELYALLYEEYGDAGQNGNIKDFISTKLAEQRQEIIEIIEKEKETHDGFGKNYLNQIINLIKQK